MPRVKKLTENTVESLTEAINKLTLKVESLESELKNFKPNNTESPTKRSKRIPAVIEVPKRPLTPYIIYSNEIRKEGKFKDKKAKEVVIEIAKQWKELK